MSGTVGGVGGDASTARGGARLDDVAEVGVIGGEVDRLQLVYLRADSEGGATRKFVSCSAHDAVGPASLSPAASPASPAWQCRRR